MKKILSFGIYVILFFIFSFSIFASENQANFVIASHYDSTNDELYCYTPGFDDSVLISSWNWKKYDPSSSSWNQVQIGDVASSSSKLSNPDANSLYRCEVNIFSNTYSNDVGVGSYVAGPKDFIYSYEKSGNFYCNTTENPFLITGWVFKYYNEATNFWETVDTKNPMLSEVSTPLTKAGSYRCELLVGSDKYYQDYANNVPFIFDLDYSGVLKAGNKINIIANALGSSVNYAISGPGVTKTYQASNQFTIPASFSNSDFNIWVKSCYGSDCVEETKVLTVTNNAPKSLTYTDTGIYKVGETLTLNLNAVDDDADTLTYTTYVYNSTDLIDTISGSSFTYTIDSKFVHDLIKFDFTVTDGKDTISSVYQKNILNSDPVLSSSKINYVEYNDTHFKFNETNVINDADSDSLTINYALHDGTSLITAFDSNSDFILRKDLVTKDNIHYVYRVNDGYNTVDLSGVSVLVGNTAPKILDLTINPSTPKTSDDLTYIINSVDLDGDFLTTTCVWDVAGLTYTTAILSNSNFNSGDLVTLNCVVDDGFGGVDTMSASKRIDNAVPVVSNIVLSGSYKVGSNLSMSVSATDADSDTLTYAWYVNGVLESSASSFDYKIPSYDTFNIQVDVSDGIDIVSKTDSFTSIKSDYSSFVVLLNNIIVRNSNQRISFEIIDEFSNKVKDAQINLSGNHNEILTTDVQGKAFIDINETVSGNVVLTYKVTHPSYNSVNGTITYTVVDDVYEIKELKTFEDSLFSLESTNFIRGEEIFLSFKVYDPITNTYLTPSNSFAKLVGVGVVDDFNNLGASNKTLRFNLDIGKSDGFLANTLAVAFSFGKDLLFGSQKDLEVNITNAQPRLIDELDDLILHKNDTKTFDLSNYFDDYEDDVLSYSTTGCLYTYIGFSSNIMTLKGLDKGECTIQITATDSEGDFISDIFDVEVLDFDTPIPSDYVFNLISPNNNTNIDTANFNIEYYVETDVNFPKLKLIVFDGTEKIYEKSFSSINAQNIKEVSINDYYLETSDYKNLRFEFILENDISNKKIFYFNVRSGPELNNDGEELKEIVTISNARVIADGNNLCISSSLRDTSSSYSKVIIAIQELGYQKTATLYKKGTVCFEDEGFDFSGHVAKITVVSGSGRKVTHRLIE